jgi:hypothetical protein
MYRYGLVESAGVVDQLESAFAAVIRETAEHGFQLVVVHTFSLHDST